MTIDSIAKQELVIFEVSDHITEQQVSVQYQCVAYKGRLVRLIPDHNENDLEKKAIKTFFNHRLASDPHIAKQEWLDIVEARHVLWKHMSSAKRELIRSFLNLLNLEIVKRARPSSVFNFESASVGNMFLTG